MTATPSRPDTTRLGRLASGPLLTLIAIIATELLALKPPLVPNVSALHLVTVALSAFTGGLVPGLVSAILVALYPLVLPGSPDRLLHYSPEGVNRILVLAFAAPAMALVAGTLKRRLERAIHARATSRASRELTDLVEGLEAIIWEADARTRRFTFVSQHAGTALGYPVQRWIDEPDFWWTHIHPEDRDAVSRRCMEALDAGLQTALEYRALAADGRVVWLRNLMRITKDAEGEARWLRGVILDITERKRIEDALRESEGRYHLAAHAVREMIWDRDLLTGKVWRSEGLRTLFGYGPELSSEDAAWWYERIHPDDRSRVASGIEGLTQSDSISWSDEYRFLKRDGDYAFVVDRGYVLHDQTGRAVRIVGATLDLTDRKRAEEELRNSERKLREAQSAGHVGSWEWNILTDSVTWSEELYRIWGVGPDLFQATHDGVIELVHPDDREALRTAVGKAVTELHPYELESRIIHPDGTERVIQSRGEVITDAAGRPVRLIGTGQDVTERKAAEQALRASETQFRAVFDGALDAMLIADDHRVLLDVNPATCRLLGRARDAIVGRSLDDFIDKAPTQDVESPWRTFIAKGEMTGSWTVRSPDGATREAEFAARANFLPGRHLATARDVTHRHLLEARLRESQKLEAVGTLAGGIAHDFNNLMTVVTGCASLALLGLRPEDPLRCELVEIGQAAQRASALTRQLLAFGRRQHFEMKVLDLDGVILRMEVMLKRLVGERIEIVTLAGRLPHTVKVDEGQLEQVVMNLVLNAKDSMRDRGTLTIEAGSAEITNGDRAGRLVTLEEGAYALLRVSDTGAGMDEATLARAFEPFFTTKEAGKGSGLGLSTAYGIVKQSGGEILISSKIGVGTTVTVLLPLVGGPEADTWRSAQAASEAAPASGVETVLVVEDEAMVRELVRRTLAMHGYQVVEAASGDEALERISGEIERIDLVVTDVVMPRMSGLELCRRMKESRPDLKVLFISGYALEATSDDLPPDPSSSFLPKPFTPPTLARKVREVLDRSPRSMSRGAAPPV